MQATYDTFIFTRTKSFTPLNQIYNKKYDPDITYLEGFCSGTLTFDTDKSMRITRSDDQSFFFNGSISEQTWIEALYNVKVENHDMVSSDVNLSSNQNAFTSSWGIEKAKPINAQSLIDASVKEINKDSKNVQLDGERITTDLIDYCNKDNKSTSPTITKLEDATLFFSVFCIHKLGKLGIESLAMSILFKNEIEANNFWEWMLLQQNKVRAPKTYEYFKNNSIAIGARILMYSIGIAVIAVPLYFVSSAINSMHLQNPETSGVGFGQDDSWKQANNINGYYTVSRRTVCADSLEILERFKADVAQGDQNAVNDTRENLAPDLSLIKPNDYFYLDQENADYIEVHARGGPECYLIPSDSSLIVP